VSAGISGRLAGVVGRPDSRHKTDFYELATQLLGDLRDLAALPALVAETQVRGSGLEACG
jgi:hypothetical protein